MILEIKTQEEFEILKAEYEGNCSEERKKELYKLLNDWDFFFDF